MSNIRLYEKISLSGIILFSLVLFSCHKSKTEKPLTDVGYGYYPLTVGRWIVYDVDSTYYISSVAKNAKYQIKELMESQFSDNSNRSTMRIERYVRLFNDTVPYDQLPWDILNVYTANINFSDAERVEQGQRYLKLVFPTVAGKKWNGNIFNAQDAWDYEYSSVNSSQTITFSFDSTLTVSQTGLNDPLINTQLASEVYAKNVGMIYKRYKVMKMLPDTSGSEYTMTINDYSH